MLRKMETKWAQEICKKKIKNRRMAIWKHKTKFKSNRIQHNWTKKNTNRSKITRNITQFKTNIQRNNTK